MMLVFYILAVLFALKQLRLRRGRNTRYGWVVNPFPTGTFTLQDAPSFAWRSNAVNHRQVKVARFFECKISDVLTCPSAFALLCVLTPQVNNQLNQFSHYVKFKPPSMTRQIQPWSA